MGEQACKLKIILNGGTVYNEAEELCNQVEQLAPEKFSYNEGYTIVRLLNTAENAVLAAKRVFLEMNGFSGPWPGSLDNPEVLRLVDQARKEAGHGQPTQTTDR
jgi:hypothetical protein